MIENIVGALVLTALVGASTWALRRWGASLLEASVRAARTGWGALLRVSQRSLMRLRVARAARGGGDIAVEVVGINPTRVTWTGAQPSVGWYYRDRRKYRSDLQAGKVPPTRAFCCGKPPRVGTRRVLTQ